MNLHRLRRLLRSRLPVSRRYLRRALGDIRVDIADEITMLGEIMTSAQQLEQEQWDRLGTLVGLIKAEVASLHEQIDEATRDRDEAVQAALDEDAVNDVARLKSRLDELESILPVTVPSVPTPGPGDAAQEPPAGGDSSGAADPSAPAEGDGTTNVGGASGGNGES